MCNTRDFVMPEKNGRVWYSVAKCKKCRELYVCGKLCKSCKASYDAQYRTINDMRLRELAKDWYESNKLIVAEKSRAKYYSDLDASRKKSRDNARKHAHEKTEYYRQYYLANKDRKTVYHYLDRLNNPEKYADRHKRHYSENKDKYFVKRHKRRALEQNSSGVFSAGIREKLFISQKGLCACCGELLGTKYHLDHIIPLSKGGRNSDDNVQLLTPRCNLMKHDKTPEEFEAYKKLLRDNRLL